MSNTNILISGSSIAGLALAHWLHHYGFTPTVVEQAAAPRDGGHAVDLRGAARDAVARMGLLDEVRRANLETRGMAYVDHAGRRLASMSSDVLGDSGGAIAELEILRGDLVRILYGAVHDDVEFIFDDSITDLAQGDDGVKASFARSGPRIFDLVVGADGLHSNVRALAFGDEDRFLHDLGSYVSIFTAPLAADLDGWELLYNRPGKTAGMYPSKDDNEVKAMFFFASPPLEYQRHDINAQKRLLSEAFADEAWEVPRLLDAVDTAPDFYFDSVSQVHAERWSNERAVLVGDAAYCPSPMAGMGTSLALVGAFVLAGELATANGDYRSAFTQYESEMRDYVTGGQKLAKTNAIGLLPRSRLQMWLRNQTIRTLPYMPWKRLVAGGADKAANAIQLKDYTP